MIEEYCVKFDEADLKNLIYKEVVQILEPLEWKGKYKGNAHHLTQEICERLSSVIKEKIDMIAADKIKIEWKFDKKG